MCANLCAISCIDSLQIVTSVFIAIRCFTIIVRVLLIDPGDFRVHVRTVTSQAYILRCLLCAVF